MKRMKILNRRIEQIFKKKQDHDLVTKLKTIKPTIDVKCPESYVFFKNQRAMIFRKNLCVSR